MQYVHDIIIITVILPQLIEDKEGCNHIYILER